MKNKIKYILFFSLDLNEELTSFDKPKFPRTTYLKEKIKKIKDKYKYT